uniref:DUF3106 domain-containing protein n=1 Tax=uncultured Thiotrichaceae bacterium TaxID=298394 RepID=A0A6S6T803_9GAMM|nr:MAG: Unknown protein [uncultured Thiotrichaceae bacterium]
MNAKNTNRYYFPLLVFVLVFQVFSIKVYAGGVSWEQLSGQEKNVLSHLKQRWNGYSDYKQVKMQRWAKQPKSARRLIKKRFKQWSKLTVPRRSKIKSELRRFKEMSPSKREKLKAWWRWLKKLPVSVQRKLKKKLPGMTKAQKKAYIEQLEKQYGPR